MMAILGDYELSFLSPNAFFHLVEMEDFLPLRKKSTFKFP
jgi:hypothetical protein